MFGLVSGVVFLSFTGFFFYYMDGISYMRHCCTILLLQIHDNFSIYFYRIHLHYENEISLLKKLKQDLLFCFFVEKGAFVAFNKVITAQYPACVASNITMERSNMKIKERLG
ncbi:hypothetical protein I3760_14G011800 [Carya illinoinensis]|nr:hypothetical protein I3760_14G011800 [Carya illinoinensis]